MITRPRFVSLFRDKAVEFWSKAPGFEVRIDVPREKERSALWIEHPDDHLGAAVRLVQRELGGIVVC